MNGMAAIKRVNLRPILFAKYPAMKGLMAAVNGVNDDIHDFSSVVIIRPKGLSVSQCDSNFTRNEDVHVRHIPAVNAIKLPGTKKKWCY